MTTVRNPAPVDVPTQTTVIPLSQIDRAPAPVSAATDPGITGGGTSTVPTPPVSEQPVDTTGVSTGSSTVVVDQPPYLTINDEGTLVLDKTTVLNFVGNGVSVTKTGASTANVNIVANATSSYGNSNVVTLLNNFGSNTISTTGNISGAILAPDGNGSVVINASGILGSASGFNYDQSANMLFTPGITADGSANTGINAIYAGIGGYTVLGSDVMVQLTSNLDSYTQINAQNINPGSFATSDYIITADNGTDSTYYLDLGLGGSGHQDPDFFGDTGSANDGYLYVTATDQAGPSNGAGNLLIGSTNGVIKLFVGNTAQANVIATVASDGISVTGNIVGVTANNSGYMQWVGNSSGDGNGYTTLGLIPDETLTGTDQYLIIDPTAPGHIHIRAGGTQDNSSADLILGGENSHVRVTAGSNPPVYVLANNYSWSFGVDSQFSAAGNIYTLGEVRSGATVTPPVTLANLTAVAGARAFVNNANLVAAGNFGAQISSGGSNTVPVWSDGTNWYIG